MMGERFRQALIPVIANLDRLDIFPLRDSDYDRMAFTRRLVREVVPFGMVPVFTAEDVLLAKLSWFDRGGRSSERQWSDVRGIASLQGARLDREYLGRWASELGLLELLDAALTPAADGPSALEG